MSIALDIGTYRMRSLRTRGNQLVGKSSRAIYAVLSDTKSARDLLDKTGTPYAICEESLIVIGDAAADISTLFGVPCISLFQAGKLPHDDPPARQVIRALLESLLPAPVSPGETCCMTLPCAPAVARPHADQDFQLLTQLVQLAGYRPLVFGSAMGVVLAELVSESFTGIGLTFGAGSCEVCLAHRGVEIAHYMLPLGGNWIDTELAKSSKNYLWDAAGEKHLDTESAARWKTSNHLSLIRSTSEQEKFLAELYGELVAHVVTESARELGPTSKACDLPQPLNVVVSGGAARIPGFLKLLRQHWDAAPISFKIGEIRLAVDSDFTVARGCLIKAELETQAGPTKSAAAA